MSRMTYQLSDGLAALGGAFSACAETGVHMDTVSVGRLVLTLAALEKNARLLENEISRHRWNEAARSEVALCEF
ncbi:hypothetical protein [Pelagibacterium halotolerans]|uniref:Uncharacterized protein n=1 Tax=Pelagibacterium halotolerans (strain DSM 22347 / JCM 15775 / CGMCC 1.7692 / B2) TaxID=1082931 RepID=G4RDF3_PELHB|nr:hypothetical protein [Pelagibacterium halotolerans]AEQ50779.1 hypothetical protein KKY_740 [Pelagibacterium halotolerans B2]QJR19304.1 hypothetical protein HKM20_13160 [Pelagibacterium halotolerans]SDZ95638.1 hypothetical protein SAMN05428936_101666 [Pelagibacterium halotolerans]